MLGGMASRPWSVSPERVPLRRFQLHRGVCLEEVQLKRILDDHGRHVQPPEVTLRFAKGPLEARALHGVASLARRGLLILSHRVGQTGVKVTSAAEVLTNAGQYTARDIDIDGPGTTHEDVATAEVILEANGLRECL